MFLLFRPEYDPASRQLSFLAAEGGIAGIAAGTPAMIAQMLADLGYAESQAVRWSVQPMLTSYLADDPDADDWRERWRSSWLISVELAQQPRIPPFLPQRLVRSHAGDAGWRASPHEPPAATILADFYTRAELARAEALFAAIARLRGDASAICLIRRLLPESAPAVLAQIVRAFRRPSAGRLCARRRATTIWPYQMLISLVPSRPYLLEDDAALRLLADLCYEPGLGATTCRDELELAALYVGQLQRRFGTRRFVPFDLETTTLDQTRQLRYVRGLHEHRPNLLQPLGSNAAGESAYAFLHAEPIWQEDEHV